MKPTQANGAQLATLARRTEKVRLVESPNGGWLRTVREALGLSRRVLAERLEVTQAAVRDYEVAETNEAISLATLRRAARSLDCELVVALVPTQGRSFAELAPAADHQPRSSPRNRRPATTTPSATNAADAEELAEYLK